MAGVHGMRFTSTRTRTSGLLLALTCVLAARPADAQIDTPEELLLRTNQVVGLTRQALSDLVDPIGGVLGRITPASSYATSNHGFGYGSISLGVTGLEFEITSPDYTEVGPDGIADTINGPFGAVYADVDVGLFRGYRTQSGLRNIGSADLLLRFGATLGDQDDLSEDVDLGSWGAIYGAGLRVGLIRTASNLSVSTSFGTSLFTERTFRVVGSESGNEFDVSFDFEQLSSFVMLEIARPWKVFVPYVGGGVVKQSLEANFDAEVSASTGEVAGVSDGVKVRVNQPKFFGGLEIGRGFFRLDLEAGSLDGNPYGTFNIRLVPFPG